MAEAVNYVLNQWTELNLFCSDGAVQQRSRGWRVIPNPTPKAALKT
jgi:hypothetical protein